MPTNFREKAGQVASSLIKGALRLVDPTKIDSQVERSDLMEPDSEPAIGTAKDLVQLGEERFEEARYGRWSHNARIFSGIAMFQGRQYDYWDEDSGSMQPIPGTGNRNPDFDEKMSRSKVNIIRVMAERAVARVMAAEPDAWAAPQTNDPRDKAAAQILRAINAHCAYRNHRREMLEEAMLASYISTTVFVEVGWDSKAWADVGLPQPDGTIKYKRAQIGDVTNQLMLCIDAYPDPNAALANGDIHQGAYFIKRCIRTTEFIQDKWGVTVEATAPTSTYGFLEQRLEYIAGDHTRDASKIKHCTDVTEVWERPSKMFVKGRFWVYTADGTILHAGPWPYEKNDEYPFIPVRYQKNQASIWGLNGVDDLKPVQVDYNDLASYLRSRLQWDRVTTYVPTSCEISPDALKNPRVGNLVPFKDLEHGGGEIKFGQPPSPPPWLFEYEKTLVARAEYIAGIRDFNSDAQPPPTSGFEFELRVEQEKARFGPVIRHMENVACKLMEWDGALYRQFGTQFPRVLGLDDKSNPAPQDTGAAALMDLRALKDGNTRVVLQPGSGQSKSPAAQQKRIDEVVAQLANPNMTPPLAKLYLSLNQDVRSDKQVDEFIQEFSGYFALQQQQQLAVQQMKGQQSQDQNAQKAQQEKDAAQIAQQTAEAEAAIKVHTEAQTQTWRMQADQAVEAARTKNSEALEQQKFEHAWALLQAQQAQPKFSVSMPFKPAANAIRSAEKAMGFEPDTPADIKEANAPPPKTAPAKPKPKSGSGSRP